MGLVGTHGEGLPGTNDNTAAKIGIFVGFLLVAAAVSLGLYFALRAAGSPPSTYAAYKLVDPPSSLAAAGAILLPMMEVGGVLWWAYTKDATSIGLVPKSGGGWRLVSFNPKGGANAVPVACSAWAESLPGAESVPGVSSAPPVTAGAWKSVGGPIVSLVGLGENDLAKFKLEEEPTKVAAVNASRPLGACPLLRDATLPGASTVTVNAGSGVDPALAKYDSYAYKLVTPPGPLSFAHGRTLQPMIEPPSATVSGQRAVWWEYIVPPGSEYGGYASIAVVRASGAWKLVAFVALGSASAKCEEWAESTAIDGPWTFNAVPLAFKLERTAAANAATKPLPLLGASCPPVTLPALLVMSSRLPVLASVLVVQNLLPLRGADRTMRWASNHGGTGTCVYVIDLEKEPSFRAGLAAGLASGPVDGPATWGLFLYSSTSRQYRGLAYSTRRTQQPPPNTDGAWVSPWTIPVASPIPAGLLGIGMGATVAHAGSATFPAFQEGPRGLWQTPIRLPPLDETTTFGGVTVTLGTYEWAPATAPTTKPESDLTTGTSTSKYTPELYGSGVRWWLKGETTEDSNGEARTYPDVYVQQWSSSAVEDQPALEHIGTPAWAKWVVYSPLPLRADAAAAPGLAPAVLALVAWSVEDGGSGLPPAGMVWSCTDPQGSSRRLPFELTPVGQATVEASAASAAAAAEAVSPLAPPSVSTGSSPPPSIEPSPAEVALVYPLELSANSPSAPLLGLAATPTGSSQVGQVVFAAKRATKGGVSTVWWVAPTRANSRFARIAVMPVDIPTATVLGMWELAGIDALGVCTSLAVGFDAAVGTPGPPGASWMVLNEGGQGPDIVFDVRKSQTAVVPAEDPLPVCALGPEKTNPYTSTPAVEQVPPSPPPSPPPPAPDVAAPSPPPTSGGVYPLELLWSAASAPVWELLAAPSNPALDGAAVVFSAMIDVDAGETPKVWWVAPASSGTRFTRVAVIPLLELKGTWLLVGESDAAAVIDVWTILAACHGVAGRSTPHGASWRAVNGGSDPQPPIVFPLSDRTSNGVVIPIRGTLPGNPYGLTYGDARTNPFTRSG